MKKILLIILLLLPLYLGATTYYVATDGDDGTGDGSIGSPLATINEALQLVFPGDTIYIRGGVYNLSSIEGTIEEINGTYDNPINILNYPDESPILDGKSLFIWYSDYYYIRGITVRNVMQPADSSRVYGFYFVSTNGITIENCVAHDIGTRAFGFLNIDTINVINCDAYNVVDTLADSPGNAGDGFVVMRSSEDTTSYISFTGCRAWNVSDDGWDVHHRGQAVWDSCWAFLCGSYGGCDLYSDGNGFKTDLSVATERTIISRKLTNCFAAYNRNAGFNTNDNGNFPLPQQVYNNTSVYNGTCTETGSGFRIFNSSGTDAQELARVFKNNIAYGNTDYEIFISSGALATNEYNSWNTPPGKTVNESSFLSVPDSSALITALSGSRGEDWSLPDLGNIYKPDPDAPTANNVVDQGTDVGLDYEGDAPDLGAFEYSTAAETIREFIFPKKNGKGMVDKNGKPVKIRR